MRFSIKGGTRAAGLIRGWLLGLLWVAAGHTAAGGTEADPALAVPLWAQHVLASADHGGRPFAVVDKQAARLVVFDGRGQPVGSTAVLLGRVTGDHSQPGVGERTQRGQLRPEDATTPSGRFVATPGHNHTGEAIVWLDTEQALAIHRLRPGAAHADRTRRLVAGRPAERRVSAGCVVVPVAFFERVVQPWLGQAGGGVVYVLPETAAWQGQWNAVARRSR